MYAWLELVQSTRRFVQESIQTVLGIVAHFESEVCEAVEFY